MNCLIPSTLPADASLLARMRHHSATTTYVYCRFDSVINVLKDFAKTMEGDVTEIDKAVRIHIGMLVRERDSYMGKRRGQLGALNAEFDKLSMPEKIAAYKAEPEGEQK